MNKRDEGFDRCALLLHPRWSLNRETIKQIAAEGFTNVGCTLIGLAPDDIEGFSVERARELAGLAEQAGLGLCVFTGYMKYRELLLKEEPSRAVIVVGAEQRMDSDGLPSRWLCPFRPENKQLYLGELMEVAGWPATREVHLNDEAALGFATGAIGCYCDWCIAEFESVSGEQPPREADWASDLWWAWLDHRFRAWGEVHAWLRKQIKDARPDIEVGMAHSPIHPCFLYNPWKTAISLARDARTLDFFATDPYHFIHSNIIGFRPHRRICTEATRSLVGACVGRNAQIMPQGFMPPGKSAPLERRDGLLAGIVPFALGARSVMPYSYEQMKIIPGYFDAFQESRRLYGEMESRGPYSFATALYPLQSEVRGHPTSNWGAIQGTALIEAMRNTGLPWGWFWDERIDDAEEELRGPLVVPNAHCLTANQMQAIERVVDRGDGALWIGNVARDAWSGSGGCPLPTKFEIGEFELVIDSNLPLFEGLTRPVMLSSRVGWSGPDGDVVGTVDGGPGLVLVEEGNRRDVWLAGIPMTAWAPKGLHGAMRHPTGGCELLKRLLMWVAARPPVARLDPFPPPSGYGRLRPWDRRDVPTAELLPMTDEKSVLAIVFSYMGFSCETSLVVAPPGDGRLRSIRELWQNEDLTGTAEITDDGGVRIPLSIPNDCELLAIRVEFD